MQTQKELLQEHAKKVGCTGIIEGLDNGFGEAAWYLVQKESIHFLGSSFEDAKFTLTKRAFNAVS
jgi:hypothetical protein